MNSRLTVAIHVIGMIAWIEREQNRPAKSDELAESVGAHPVFVRETLSMLSSAGLVEGRRGRSGGTVLSRRAEEITLAQVYSAVRDDTPLLGQHPSSANSSCRVAPIIKSYLSEAYSEAEALLVAGLAERTVDAMSRHVVEALRDGKALGRIDQDAPQETDA